MIPLRRPQSIFSFGLYERKPSVVETSQNQKNRQSTSKLFMKCSDDPYTSPHHENSSTSSPVRGNLAFRKLLKLKSKTELMDNPYSVMAERLNKWRTEVTGNTDSEQGDQHDVCQDKPLLELPHFAANIKRLQSESEEHKDERAAVRLKPQMLQQRQCTSSSPSKTIVQTKSAKLTNNKVLTKKREAPSPGTQAKSPQSSTEDLQRQIDDLLKKNEAYRDKLHHVR